LAENADRMKKVGERKKRAEREMGRTAETEQIILEEIEQEAE